MSESESNRKPGDVVAEGAEAELSVEAPLKPAAAGEEASAEAVAPEEPEAVAEAATPAPTPGKAAKIYAY